MASTKGTVNRADGKSAFVQLRVDADDSFAFVSACGPVMNGTDVQVLSQKGNFYKIQVAPVAAARVAPFVGFVKKQYIVLPPGECGQFPPACMSLERQQIIAFSRCIRFHHSR
jgi:hypothetical protein